MVTGLDFMVRGRFPANGGRVGVSEEVVPPDMDAAQDAQRHAEALLVDRARAGDAGAYGELVTQYQRRVVSVAYRFLGNSEDAADVGQEAFVRCYRNLEQLEDATRFGAWLIRSACNLALNFRRARKLRLARSLDAPGDGSEDSDSPTSGEKLSTKDSGDHGPLSAELKSAIQRGMAELPEKQRLALVLFSVEGMAQKDVAEVLECSVELVKWNVFQARKKMKEMLGEYL